MFTRALAAVSLGLVVAACGPVEDPTLLAEQKPYVRLTISTEVGDDVATALPRGSQSFELSSTFAFDHFCEFENGMRVSVRADAAPALQADFLRWTPMGSRFAVDCTNDGVDCPSDRVHVRWDGEGGRFDAQPAKKHDGVPQASMCSASFVADALDPDLGVVEGECTNLLGAFSKTGAQPVFGPVTVSFRALCRRP